VTKAYADMITLSGTTAARARAHCNPQVAGKQWELGASGETNQTLRPHRSAPPRANADRRGDEDRLRLVKAGRSIGDAERFVRSAPMVAIGCKYLRICAYAIEKRTTGIATQHKKRAALDSHVLHGLA